MIYIIRVYLFFDKNVYIFDRNHPSHFGSEKINDSIIREIRKIEAKKNKF